MERPFIPLQGSGTFANNSGSPISKLNMFVVAGGGAGGFLIGGGGGAGGYLIRNHNLDNNQVTM